MNLGRTSRYLLGAALIAVTVSGSDLTAATAPAPSSINAKDKAEGAKAHPQLIAEYGGALTGPQADYVAGIGKKIAEIGRAHV